MPTTVHSWQERSRDLKRLQETYTGGFLHGGCYVFALALHQGLGWPMVGLIRNERGHDRIRHAAVRNPDGRLFDIRGYITEEEIGTPFSYEPPYDLREITIADLEANAHTQSYSIKRARNIAEILWPELPWREKRISKVTAFADELEALCRKHKFWIRAPVPAQAPILTQEEGDESGYVLRPTFDGLSYTINRRLR